MLIMLMMLMIFDIANNVDDAFNADYVDNA